MAVIELDLDAPPPAPVRPPPAHRYRYAGLTVATVLLLALGGAAPVTSALWRPLGLIPLLDGNSTYALAGGAVYTVDGVGEGRWRTTAWAGPALRRAWSVTTDNGSDRGDGVEYGGVNLVAADGNLLVQDTGMTSVVDARTGDLRWSVPGPVVSLGSGLALTVETSFRPGTEYDVASGAPGELFWSSTGQPHTEPPRSTTLHGVELATGRRLWSTRQRGSVRTAQAAGDTAAVVVVGFDGLKLLAADTGRVLREAPPPRPGDVSYVEFTGDLVLVRSGRTNRAGSMSAYAMDTLEFRWQRPDLADGGDPGWCYGLACGTDPSGLTVLDPRTGRAAWRAGPGLSLVRRGGIAMEVGAGAERRMRVRDMVTGDVRAELPSWDTLVGQGGTGPFVVRRRENNRGATAFGLVRPDGSAVQPLGVAHDYVNDCLVDERFVACRMAGGVEVWSYRA